MSFSGWQARQICAAFATALISFGPLAASAQDFGDPDERQRQLEPVPGLSETLSGIVLPQSNDILSRVDTLRDIFRALGGCWHLPAGEGPSGQVLTLRLAFKRNGEVLGKPRVTYYRSASGDRNNREAFIRSVQDAFTRCQPLPFTKKLGAAVAGRVFIFRFSDTAPM